MTKIKHEAHEPQRTNSQCAEHPCLARSLKQALYQIIGKRLSWDSWEGSREVALEKQTYFVAHQCEKAAISWKWGLGSGELRQDVREGQYTRKRVARVGVILLRKETSQRRSHEEGLNLETV